MTGDALRLRRLEVDAFVGEVCSLRLSRAATVLVLGAYVCVIGGPLYLLTFVAPHMGIYLALFALTEHWRAKPDSEHLSHFVVRATALRVGLAAHACWCGLDLRAAHGLATEGGLLILSSLMLSALQAQPSRAGYLAGLAPPFLTLLFIGFLAPGADPKVGGALTLFLVAVLTTTFRTRKAMQRGLALQADLTIRNGELCDVVAAAELAEEIGGLGRWGIHLPTGVLSWSRGTFLVHGMAPSVKSPSVEEAVAKYHPDDRNIVDEAVDRAVRGEGVLAFRHRLLTSDGSLRHVAVMSKLVESAAGTSLIGVIQDVTEQITAAQAIRESEERFRSLAEAASDVIVRTGMDGIVTYISPAVEHATGYRPEELIGGPSISLMDPRDVPQCLAAFLAAKTAMSRAPWSVTYRVRHREGGIRWVQARLRLLFDADTGEPATITAVVRDITEETQAEEVLAASEARYRLLAENATDVTTRSTMDGRMTFVTPASLKVLGYSPEEMIGKRFNTHIHPDDYKPLIKRLSAFVAAGVGAEPIINRYRYRRKDGAWIWLEGAPRVIFDPVTGEAAEVQDTVRDVTARAEIEAELVASREAAEAGAQAKSDFLANMSHELRTPLNSIVGFAGLIADAPELSSETRRHATLVAAASGSLVQIVNDVLDVSAFEAEGVSLDPRPIELDLLLHDVADLLRGEAERKGLTLAVQTPPASAPVLVDAARLRQVLLNLLGNAIKFTQAGRVTLTLSRDARGAIKISVRDTGIGIPADRQTRIFDRFAQADVSTSRRFGGTGLGLAISRSIVEAMGGAIGVASVEGAGSTFWLTLDLLEAELPSPTLRRAETAEDARSLIGLRVLLADDNPVNRELFAVLMRTTGIAITAVENGAEALHAVQESSFDIIFMDVQMPIMDGLEATRAIKALDRPAPPIVALTANVLAAEVDRCLVAGMDDHLAKPYTPQEVLDRIRRWVTHISARDPETGLSLTVIADLEASIGAAALNSFIDRLAEQLHVMASLLVAKDSDTREVALQAHSVRGLAGTLGFSEIARTYAELEDACRDGGADVGGKTLAAATATEFSLAMIARRRIAG